MALETDTEVLILKSRKLHLAVLVVILALVAATSAQARSQFSARLLSDARVGKTKTELIAQKNYSASVIAAIKKRGAWRYAPRHKTCWSHVPWSSLCNRVRSRLLAHRWLYAKAAARFAVMYPVAVWPAHHALWVCISKYESGGDPHNKHNPSYRGYLQMSFGWLNLISGDPADYSQYEQEQAAETGYAASNYSSSFLYGQWFNYDGAAGDCMRYA